MDANANWQFTERVMFGLNWGWTARFFKSFACAAADESSRNPIPDTMNGEGALVVRADCPKVARSPWIVGIPECRNLQHDLHSFIYATLWNTPHSEVVNATGFALLDFRTQRFRDFTNEFGFLQQLAQWANRVAAEREGSPRLFPEDHSVLLVMSYRARKMTCEAMSTWMNAQ